VKTPIRFAVLAVAVLACNSVTSFGQPAPKLKALIVDGQNNHDWKSCQPVLAAILEQSGRFTVDVSTTPPAAPAAPAALKGDATPAQQATYDAALAKWKADSAALEQTRAAAWQAWRPAFANYAVVVLNYNGEAWPEEVKKAFVAYVEGGGGVAVVHAADNAFADWPEYNEIIGVGGWGGRNEKSGPMIRWRDGKFVEDTTPGIGGTHGPQHEFLVESRADHPILRGLPPKWKHVKDELYSKMRGPAKNMTVLATAYADPALKGTGEHEPILMTIGYGRGRVFHTVLGHGPEAMAGLGFQVTLQRGAEWAATGKVTIAAPQDGTLSADVAAVRPLPAR
jgi:uncharacterized protein